MAYSNTSDSVRPAFQYRLRSLLAVVTVCCIVVACVTAYLRASAQFDAAAKPFESENARVYGQRFRGRLGIYAVVFARNTTTDATISRVAEDLKRLPNLEHVGLDSSQVTDAAMRDIEPLTGLKVLSLSDTHVTNAGLESLKGMTELQELTLDGTAITDAGLAHMTEFGSLRLLALDRTGVTDAGLLHLEELANLRYLEVMHTQVTGEGIKRLKRALPNCAVAW
jgi:internalin A